VGDESLGPAPYVYVKLNLTGNVLTPGRRDNPSGEADRRIMSPSHDLALAVETAGQ
jgi:hypothetical protein